MIRCSSASVAVAAAAREGQWYSWSVLDGRWYVGTVDQLLGIGCIDIRDAGTARDSSASEQAPMSGACNQHAGTFSPTTGSNATDGSAP